MKPILFSTPMVKAILEGRKTHTRRVIKEDKRGTWEAVNDVRRNSEYGATVPCYLLREISVDDKSPNIMYPKYDVGDILWVRETWRICPDGIFCYKAIGDCDTCSTTRENAFNINWKPSIFMPREACRLFLKITDIRVQRLQEITEEDAMAEGVKAYGPNNCSGTSARIAFAQLWDSLNERRGYEWRVNPWVWAISFERIKKPAK